MKAISLNIIAVLLWVAIGHFFSSFVISLTAFYFPIIFIALAMTVGKKTHKYVYIIVCFILLLINDYLFRIYGGGIHDDAGRGICEIVFYATLTTSALSLLFLKIIDSSKKDNVKLAPKIFIDILFIVLMSLATLLFFRNFNISI